MPASTAANEPAPGPASTAYAYTRMETPDEIEIALQRKEIGTFCAEQGATLGVVFVDRGMRGDATTRIQGTASRLLAVYGGGGR